MELMFSLWNDTGSDCTPLLTIDIETVYKVCALFYPIGLLYITVSLQGPLSCRFLSLTFSCVDVQSDKRHLGGMR